MTELVQRITAILRSPRTEWPVIARERTTMSELFIGYVAILAAIPPVAHLIGQLFIGEARAPLGATLVRALISYAVSFAAVYLIAVVINLLAARFDGKKNVSNALKLSVYSHTPIWLAGIFLLVPGLNFLLILGVYAFYLLWAGLPLLMYAPNRRALPYAMVVTACMLVPAIVLAAI